MTFLNAPPMWWTGFLIVTLSLLMPALVFHFCGHFWGMIALIPVIAFWVASGVYGELKKEE